MKPSEFWAQIFALPEQARQAEGEAAELRTRADALCGWARLAISVHRSAIADADVGGIDEGKKHLDALPPYPDAATIASPAVEPAPLPERTRKQRSDAGKPRGRKADGARDAPLDETAPANPADVKAVDAARAMIAGDIRRAMNDYRNAPSSDPEPVTIGWLMVTLGLPEVVIRDALKLLSLVSWRMQREGDSQPVEVWGTVEQFAQSVGRMRVRSDDRIADTVAQFQCSEFDAKRAWKLLDPMRSP